MTRKRKVEGGRSKDVSVRPDQPRGAPSALPGATPSDTVVDELRFRNEGHLGGYVEGGDPATWYPELWEFLVTGCDVSSVVDVGCGDGVALRYFADLGCTVLGVEGVPQDDDRIVRHDYTAGPFRPDASYDLCWCCETVEHIEEEFLPNLLATFQAAKLVLLTHAEPGQAGHHHVNLQTADYWKGALAGIGFRLDVPLTTAARMLARMNQSPYNHFVRSGLAFARR